MITRFLKWANDEFALFYALDFTYMHKKSRPAEHVGKGLYSLTQWSRVQIYAYIVYYGYFPLNQDKLRAVHAN